MGSRDLEELSAPCPAAWKKQGPGASRVGTDLAAGDVFPGRRNPLALCCDASPRGKSKKPTPAVIIL